MAGLYNKPGKSRKAPSVPNPHPEKPYFKESDLKSKRKSAQLPMKSKRLSK